MYQTKIFLDYVNSNKLLQRSLKFVLENNSGNYNPYHNFNHLLNTAKYSYLIGKSEDLNDVDLNKLIIASLFHDFNHVANLKDYKDFYNIENSVNGFLDFHSFNVNLFVENSITTTDIINLIIVTEFPHQKTNSDCILTEKIIRDADFCQIFEYDIIQNIILGLGKEMQITIIDRLEQQLKFVEGINYNTEYCINRWNGLKNIVVDNFTHLKNTLNVD